MIGTFQQSNLRLEVDAPPDRIRRSLTQIHSLRRWLVFVRFDPTAPALLQQGDQFMTWAGGIIPVQHTVTSIDTQHIYFTLSQGIDGFHEWSWGTNWVQSRLEGISILPLNLGQTFSLFCLQQSLHSSSQ